MLRRVWRIASVFQLIHCVELNHRKLTLFTKKQHDLGLYCFLSSSCGLLALSDCDSPRDQSPGLDASTLKTRLTSTRNLDASTCNLDALTL